MSDQITRCILCGGPIRARVSAKGRQSHAREVDTLWLHECQPHSSYAPSLPRPTPFDELAKAYNAALADDTEDYYERR